MTISAIDINNPVNYINNGNHSYWFPVRSVDFTELSLCTPTTTTHQLLRRPFQLLISIIQLTKSTTVTLAIGSLSVRLTLQSLVFVHQQQQHTNYDDDHTSYRHRSFSCLSLSKTTIPAIDINHPANYINNLDTHQLKFISSVTNDE